MKILLFTDLHMCPRASIISKWGVKYPARLENCIESVNWVERTAERFGCDYILNLGDFFDKPDLSSETITACNDIKWSEIMHYSIVGNHDASTSSLIFNSANRLLRDRHSVIVEPQILPLSDCTICFLPYIVECDRKPLSEYFKNVNSTKPRIIVSHNDINGIQLGPVVSKTGFTIEEIEANCDLFINGHLHNGQAITDKVINLGNLTGKDFGENAIKHAHNIAILDTSTLELEYIENPHAFNFYKLQIDTATDLDLLNNLKSRAIVSIKCDSALLEIVKQKVSEKHNILESRIILTRNYTSDDSSEAQDLELSVDHITRFIECCKNHIEETPMLLEEISEICK